jgi:hypothetical protein
MNEQLDHLAHTQAPRFTHDCQHCVFLGSYDDEGRVADLYVHTSGSMPTVIARYGSDGPDYCSGMSFSYGSNPALSEARRRAEERNLVEYDIYEALEYARKETPEFERLKKALPFTVEYQTWRAYKDGDIERWHGLATHLLQLERAKPYLKEHSDGSLLLNIESRIHRVLEVLGCGNWRSLCCQADGITEFLWNDYVAKTKAQPVEPELVED